MIFITKVIKDFINVWFENDVATSAAARVILILESNIIDVYLK